MENIDIDLGEGGGRKQWRKLKWWRAELRKVSSNDMKGKNNKEKNKE
jgi:hypothetical protein